MTIHNFMLIFFVCRANVIKLECNLIDLFVVSLPLAASSETQGWSKSASMNFYLQVKSRSQFEDYSRHILV